MSRVDAFESDGRDRTEKAGRVDAAASDASPFFWWVRALLAAGGAVALFPVVFAVVVSAIDLGV